MPSAAIDISRPAAEVFDFICRDHFANHPRWDSSIVAVEGGEGPAEKGTKATLVRKAGPRRLREQCEVTSFEPPRGATFVSRSGPMTIEVQAQIEPRGEASTRATLSASVSGRGPARLALPLVRRNVERSLDRSVRTIKDLIEREGGQ